jgi:uncharacterized delta-60 repeat protein
LAVRLQSSGKVVLAGVSITSPKSSSAPTAQISLVRLNVDGSRDTTFGASGDGRLHYTPAGQEVAIAYDARIDANDRIVISGAAGNNGVTTDAWLVDRLAPDGGRDMSFNNGSPQLFYMPPGNAGYATRLALTSDGIFAGGITPRTGGANSYFGVARLNLDGSLDPRFGGGGLTYGSFAATRDVDTTDVDIAVGNGGVMVAGTQAQSNPTENNNNYNFAIGRLQYDQIFSYGFE